MPLSMAICRLPDFAVRCTKRPDSQLDGEAGERAVSRPLFSSVRSRIGFCRCLTLRTVDLDLHLLRRSLFGQRGGQLQHPIAIGSFQIFGSNPFWQRNRAFE